MLLFVVVDVVFGVVDDVADVVVVVVIDDVDVDVDDVDDIVDVGVDDVRKVEQRSAGRTGREGGSCGEREGWV